jgi:hypothetical protein
MINERELKVKVQVEIEVERMELLSFHYFGDYANT